MMFILSTLIQTIHQFYQIGIDMTISIENQYKTMNRFSQFHTIVDFDAPAQYFDPRKEILTRQYADYKNKQKQKKFKPTTKHKPCFVDQQVEPYVQNPSPDKYKTLTNGFFGDSKQKNSKDLRRAKSASVLRKVDPKLTKGTYIDDIEKYQAKNKQPGIGKYDITKDPYQRKIINIKPKQLPTKRNNLDDIKYLSNMVPGAGHYCPHMSVPHLRSNRTDYKFYQKKHEKEQNERKKSQSTKLGPNTYTPVLANTFDSIAKNKSKQRSRWSHGTIDLRKGLRSQYKSPSPAQYKLTNQWIPKEPRQRQSQLGKVKLFERTSRSTRSLSVYH